MRDGIIKAVFFVLLFGFWLLLSDRPQMPIVGLGVAGAVLVVALLARMDIIDRHLPSPKALLRWLRYSMWLLLRITSSCMRVALTILRPKLSIAPGFIRVPMTQTKDFTRMIHANSITLTPGTVSTELSDDSIEVHALDHRGQRQALAELDRRVTRLEGGE